MTVETGHQRSGLVGEELQRLVEVLDVVEDQQPARVRRSAAQRLERRPGRLGDHLACAQTHLLREFRQGRHHPVGLLGLDPPDQVVVGPEPVRVLPGHLGLPDPAEPVEDLREMLCGAAAAP